MSESSLPLSSCENNRKSEIDLDILEFFDNSCKFSANFNKSDNFKRLETRSIINKKSFNNG